ncbi:MAG: hypothetical protein J1E63_10370, partial [Muribaculaceae bacterium]|nr:hypothetical protein [Muribaculaceae bacterium]
GIRNQNEQLKKNSDIAQFWHLLDSNHMQGRIISRAHFVLRLQDKFSTSTSEPIDFGRNKMLLYLNFQNVVTSLGQRINGTMVVGKLDPVSLESYLRTHPAFLGTKQTRFRVLTPTGQFDSIIETKDGVVKHKYKEVRPMAFVFDYELLKNAYSLNLDTFEREENEVAEEELKSSFPLTPPPQQEELPF